MVTMAICLLTELPHSAVVHDPSPVLKILPEGGVTACCNQQPADRRARVRLQGLPWALVVDTPAQLPEALYPTSGCTSVRSQTVVPTRKTLGRAGRDTVRNFSIKLGERRVVAKPNAIHNMWTIPVCVVLGRFHVFELLSPARLLCIVLYNTTQHNTTQHHTTQHNTTQHNTTQHNTSHRNITLHNTTTNKITIILHCSTCPLLPCTPCACFSACSIQLSTTYP